MRRRAALALLCAVNFMVILDAQIVILALPSIATDLGLAEDAAQWVLSAYLLAFGGLLALGGRAGDVLGRRRVLLAGIALFGLASLLCGLAWTPGALIAARAAQGLSAALMAPTALGILMTTFAEGRERNTALAAWSGFGGVGATAALLIGGTLTSALGWEWIFFLNVPVAAGLLVLAPRLLEESRDRRAAAGFDAVGALTLTAALVAFIYAVVEAPTHGWTSARTLGLAGLALALLAVFGATEARSRAPLVSPQLLRSRTLVGGNLVMLLAGTMAWGTSLIASRYAQEVLGWSPLEFGVGSVVLTVGAIVGADAAQALVGRIGVRAVAAGSVALLATGALLLSGVSTDGGYWSDLFPGLLAFGPGLGAGTTAAAIAALTGVREQDAGVASGMTTAAFQLGGALGSAIVTSVVLAESEGGGATLTDGLRAGALSGVAVGAVALAAALLLLRSSAPTAPARGVQSAHGNEARDGAR